MLGLLAHTRGDAAGFGILKAGRIGDMDRVPADADAGFLPGSGKARHIVDKSKPLAGEPVNRVVLPTFGRPMMATV